MLNIKLCTTTAVIALMTLAAPAFAHDGAAAGAAAHHHHHMHKNAQADFEKMHALHKKLHDVVVADKFNKKAFLAISARLEQLRSQMEIQHTEEFANKLSTMSQEDREALAEKFHEHMMDHHGDWHDGKGWGDKSWADHNSGNVDWSNTQKSDNYGREAPNH